MSPEGSSAPADSGGSSGAHLSERGITVPCEEWLLLRTQADCGLVQSVWAEGNSKPHGAAISCGDVCHVGAGAFLAVVAASRSLRSGSVARLVGGGGTGRRGGGGARRGGRRWTDKEAVVAHLMYKVTHRNDGLLLYINASRSSGQGSASHVPLVALLWHWSAQPVPFEC